MYLDRMLDYATGLDGSEWTDENESRLKRCLVFEPGTPPHETLGPVFTILDSEVVKW